jgi:hypothetical protein
MGVAKITEKTEQGPAPSPRHSSSGVWAQSSLRYTSSCPEHVHSPRLSVEVSDPGFTNVESTISYELMAGLYALWRLDFHLPIQSCQSLVVALRFPDVAIYPDKSIHLNVSYFLRKLHTSGAFTHRTWNLISPDSITTSRSSLLVCGPTASNFPPSRAHSTGSTCDFPRDRRHRILVTRRQLQLSASF